MAPANFHIFDNLTLGVPWEVLRTDGIPDLKIFIYFVACTGYSLDLLWMDYFTPIFISPYLLDLTWMVYSSNATMYDITVKASTVLES